MRLLYVSDRLPHPPVAGRARRVHALGRELIRRGHEVELLLVTPPASIPTETVKTLRGLFGSLHQIQVPELRLRQSSEASRLLARGVPPAALPFHAPEVIRAARGIVGRTTFDAVVFDGVAAASLRRHLPRGFTSVVDIAEPACVAHDAEARSRGFGFWKSIRWKLHGVLRRRHEHQTVADMDLVVVRSREDRQLLRRWVRDTRGVIVSDGVDEPELRGTDPVPGRIVVVGAFNEPVEIDGLVWFAREIFPKIRAHHPGVQAVIVGQEPDASLLALRSLDGIEVVDTDEPLDTWLESATLVAVPIRHGAGAPGQILEGLVRQRPVVATVNAARGLELEDGRHLLLAPSTDGFVLRCIKLLDRPDLAAQMGRDGAEWCRQRALWPIALRPLDTLVGHALGVPRSLSQADLSRPSASTHLPTPPK